MSKPHYFKVTVTAKAPQGYKPRTISTSVLVITDKPNAKKVAEERALADIKKGLTEGNPDIPLTWSVKSEKSNLAFVIVETKDDEKK